MKKQYYAVKKGHEPGIYTSWKEAEQQIKGYKGAVHKKFNSEDEAKEYITSTTDEIKINEDNFEARAYVDGSYNESLNSFTYGLVFLYKNQQKDFFEKFNDQEWLKKRNVAGEILATIQAIKIALENEISSLVIYHDYDGIKKFATEEWRAQDKITQSYVDYFKEISSKITIAFVKIKSHSGNELNERADRLAKEAYSLRTFSKVNFIEKSFYTERDKIQNNLKKVLQELKLNYQLEIIRNNPDLLEIKINSNQQKECIIKFNFKISGTTSIQYDKIKNPNLGFQIKTIFEKKYSIYQENRPSNVVFQFSSKKINEIKIKIFQELENQGINIRNKEHNSSIKESYGIHWKKSTVFCNIYNNKIVLQGRPSKLFMHTIFLFTCEKDFEFKEIAKITSELFNISGNHEQIIIHFKKIAPNTHSKGHHRIKNWFLQSILLLNNDFTSQNIFIDYSQVAFPALRALEGCLKDTFRKYNVILHEKKTFGKIFDTKDKKHILKSTIKSKIKNPELEKHIEKTYNFYNRNRHSTFHTSQIIDESRILEKSEAKDIIYESINLSEQLHSI